MIQIVVAGAKGRMGSRIAAMVREADDLELAGAVDAGDPFEEAIGKADAVIDFTVAAAAAEHAAIAARRGKPIVIGTTGLTAEQQGAVRKAAGRIPIVFAPNMSVGVNVMVKLVETAARALGKEFSIAIEETHHVHKLDKPSGTAKNLAEAACAAANLPAGSIEIQSFREGEVVGDHTITFSTPMETLSIAHHAATRDIFARGALAAARWIVGKSAGLYGMGDVLGLKAPAGA